MDRAAFRGALGQDGDEDGLDQLIDGYCSGDDSREDEAMEIVTAITNALASASEAKVAQ